MKPECLYKYLDVKGAVSMILNKELQFTNPCYFNDPFDSHPNLMDYDVPDGYTCGWPLKEFITKKAKTDSENDRRRAWICSLSKRNDSLLMWSYYNQHRGVCIGLRKDIMSAHLSKSNLGLMFIPNIVVAYKDIKDKPNSIRGDVNTFLYQLCTKGQEWQHEQEIRYAIINPHPWIPYRLTRESKRNEVIPWEEVKFYPNLTTECFDSIYLGCRISDSDKLRVLRAVKTALPGTEVIQMIPDPDNFCFLMEPVDVDRFLDDHAESIRPSIASKIKRWYPFKIKITYQRRRIIRRKFRS